MKQSYGTDWGYVIFVTLDQYFKYKLGPYTDPVWSYVAIPYDLADLANPENMDITTVHETGHIFGAADEYCQSPCCNCSKKYGYNEVPNLKCEAGCFQGYEDGCTSCVWSDYICHSQQECKKNEYCPLPDVRKCEHDCVMNVIKQPPNIDPVSRAQIGWVFDGDINLDCNVDIFDFVWLARYYGCNKSDLVTCPGASWDPRPDLNKDGVIGISDLVFISAHFGYVPNNC
jgi:hypothetical protein